MTYALGISIARVGNSKDGLTPSEIKDQKKQLLAFVNNDKTRVLHFDEEGYNLLDSIADAFVNRLPSDTEANYVRVLEKPYWCGFTSSGVSGDISRPGFVAHFC